MSLLRNAIAAIVPIRESRRSDTAAPLQSVNAETFLDVNGEQSAYVTINSGGANVTATLVIEGSFDGINYDFPILFYPLGGVGGTIPVLSQPMTQEAFAAVTVRRTYCLNAGGFRRIRVRLSAWTSGLINVFMTTDAEPSVHPNVRDQTAGTLLVTNTGAASAAVTATLPSVAGMRHYLQFLSVIRSATAALTAAATPVLVTTTNIPGSPVFTFGQDVAGIGVDKELKMEFPGLGLACSAIGANTTIVAPVYTGVIWRITAAYRLGY